MREDCRPDNSQRRSTGRCCRSAFSDLDQTGGAMRKLLLLGALAFASMGGLAAQSQPLVPLDAQIYSAALLARVRVAATTIPGALPTRINYIKLAESHRPMADIIDGGSRENYVSARTAFQVVYPSGSVMIDAGMDQVVHKFFGFGREEPSARIRARSSRRRPCSRASRCELSSYIRRCRNSGLRPRWPGTTSSSTMKAAAERAGAGRRIAVLPLFHNSSVVPTAAAKRDMPTRISDRRR
jgi:hypothetical protein